MVKSAPFSFHCTICVEPFDFHDRSPVVLPCGHTFLCESCSKKLNRCMECRTPLFTYSTVSNPVSPTSPLSSPTSRRYRRSSFDQQVPQKPPQLEKIPIPIPKNHVLIALMEAANTQQRLDSADLDSENDDFAVMSSIKALTADCGTYIVKERYGLPIYPEKKDGSINMSAKPHTTLSYGQRVQIVSVKDGIYKLARGIGSLFATSSQLVKIDLPKEKSCELEGMISSIQEYKNEMEQKMSNLLSIERNLHSELHECLRGPENHPVIEKAESPKIQDDMDVVMKDHRSTPSEKTMSSSFQMSDDSMCTPTPATPPMSGGEPRENATPGSLQSRSESPLYNLGPMCGGSLFAPLRSFGEDDSNLRSAAQAVQNSFLNMRRSDFHDEGSVDFRTGLSGHVGLNNARKLKHRPSNFNRSSMRMMGEHRGISHIKNIRSKDPSSSPRVQNTHIL